MRKWVGIYENFMEAKVSIKLFSCLYLYFYCCAVEKANKRECLVGVNPVSDRINGIVAISRLACQSRKIGLCDIQHENKHNAAGLQNMQYGCEFAHLVMFV